MGKKENASGLAAKKAGKGTYIVNPHGTVHQVTREQAEWRLKKPGWRLATGEEIERYLKPESVQTDDKPFGTPWETVVEEDQEHTVDGA